VVDHEVADPDGADLPVAEQRLQGTVGLQRSSEVRREGLVKDEQVDLVDAELAGTLLETVQGLVVAPRRPWNTYLASPWPPSWRLRIRLIARR